MSVAELLRRLDELGAELKVRDRPERRAWNRLEPTKNGWTGRLYDDQAFTLWNEVLRRFPDDLRSVHHLAIMHHARAIDAEQSNSPGRADADWRQALAHWHRLFDAEEFWAELAARVDTALDVVPWVRQDLAERLLRMHFDIALDERSPHHRARFHVRLALDSPFPRDLVERVRVKAYERSIQDLDAGVWTSSTFEPAVLWPAVETVTGYLDRDENCVAALNDLLALLKQVQTGQVQQANGTGDADETNQALDEIRATARKYDGYLARLEPVLLDAAEQNQLALSNLALWQSRAGQACNMRRAYDEAAGYYERALRAARAGGDPRVDEFRADWLMSTMLSARHHAAGDKRRARRLLDSIATESLPGIVLLTRAQTWMLLDDFDNAERDAKSAESAFTAPREDMPLWGEDPAQLRAECQALLKQIRQVRLIKKIEPHMDKATDAIKSGRWADAIWSIDAVLAMDKDFVPALIRRAECHLGQFETDAAGADLDRAEKLIRSAVGQERAMPVVRQLRDVLASLDKQVTAYGGPKAALLRQEGIKAFKDGRNDEAIELLRNARKADRPGATKKLDQELAHCLNIAACELVNPVVKSMESASGMVIPSLETIDESILKRMRSNGIDESILEFVRSHMPDSRSRLSSQHLTTVRQAETMLTEANLLDPSDAAIKQNLAQVKMLIQRLKGSW